MYVVCILDYSDGRVNQEIPLAYSVFFFDGLESLRIVVLKFAELAVRTD